MHAETFAYCCITCTGKASVPAIGSTRMLSTAGPVENPMIRIPAGQATLGQAAGSIRMGQRVPAAYRERSGVLGIEV